MPQSRRNKRIGIHLAGLVFSISLGCQDPPYGSLRDAESALKAASNEKALSYAEPKYRLAENLLQQGRLELARQKGRLAPFRNYAAADSLLKSSLLMANEASADAHDSLAALKARAADEIAELREELATWHEALNGSLAALTMGAHLSRADLALTVSRGLYDNGEYYSAIETLARSRESLAAIGEMISANEENERQEIDKWRRWVRETLSNSKKSGSAAVIVDKSAHKLYLVEGGELVRSFKCELGFNSAGHKLFSGDGATPEGKYRITDLRHKGSKFYKALPIDYPSKDDRRQFDENKAKGIISRRARIGAFIEIHGEGGRGYDWTNGCVALANEDITTLMNHVTAGTPVIIVRRSDRWPRN